MFLDICSSSTWSVEENQNGGRYIHRWQKTQGERDPVYRQVSSTVVLCRMDQEGALCSRCVQPWRSSGARFHDSFPARSSALPGVFFLFPAWGKSIALSKTSVLGWVKSGRVKKMPLVVSDVMWCDDMTWQKGRKEKMNEGRKEQHGATLHCTALQEGRDYLQICIE